jgi:delta 1-pyrroline-5-carboxylate dehydrogenase
LPTESPSAPRIVADRLARAPQAEPWRHNRPRRFHTIQESIKARTAPFRNAANFIGGRWVDPGRRTLVRQPIADRRTGHLPVARSQAADIELALDAAHGQDGWGRTSVAERGR